MKLREREWQSEFAPVRLSTASAGETQTVAAAIAPYLAPGDLVLLSGDLGAGKTTFVQAVAETFGVTEPVTSPTFALAHHYSGKCELRHIDLYRLADPAEMLDYILEELEESIVLVEWGAPLAAEFPDNRLDVTLHFVEADRVQADRLKGDSSAKNCRVIELTGIGQRWEDTLLSLEAEMRAELK